MKMKLTFLLFLSFGLGFSLNTHAQNRFKPSLIGGFSATQVQGDRFSGFNKFGVSAGAEIESEFDGGISLAFEILYINKGSKKIPNPKAGDFETFKLTLNYVEIPLLMRYRKGDVQFQVGFFGGALLKAESEFNGAVFDTNQEINDWEFGGIIGLRYHFSDRWFADARYSLSLIPISGNRDLVLSQPFFTDRLYNVIVQFMVGYSI